MSKFFDEVTRQYYNKIIEQRTKNTKKEFKKENSEEVKDFMTFNLSTDSLYAISSKNIFKIIDEYNLVKVPFMPSYIHGVINYRGEILTVLNLHYFFSVPFEDHNDEKLIIITYKNHKLGLLINKIKGFCRYNTEKFIKPFYSQNIINNKFVSYIFNNEVLILNIKEIFLDPKLGLQKNNIR